ncbi:MAG: transporter [Pedosphaera sp. Tous-C6FEB]|nr:MAG: transporter [Pedosphaera sp. Tous-C6FEB]
MQRVLDWLTNLFPLWALLGGALALVEPRWFAWFSGELIVWGLAIIMLGMGLTLSVADFKRVLKMPKAIAAGFLAQYSVMPFLGWGIANALPLEKHMAVGLILVACCPGGTASNVVTYLAKADVPLSVLMTMCSTFAAVVFTPLLTKWLAGALVPVDALGLFLSTVKVVLLPLLLGLALHHFAPRAVTKVLPVAPLVSVTFITLIVASVIGQNAQPIRESGGVLLLAVFLLHAGGFGLGYLFAKLFGYDRLVCRTISIEVGMQNSGLGVVLAKKHFPDTLAPVPCAVSSVFHSVIGSLLAAVWRWQEERRAKSAAPNP